MKKICLNQEEEEEEEEKEEERELGQSGQQERNTAQILKFFITDRASFTMWWAYT